MRGMVQARFSWGYYGALIPSTLVTVTLQGYLILNTIVGGQTLGSVSAHLNASLGIVIIALVTLAVVFSGSRVLHWYARLCTIEPRHAHNDPDRYNTFIWIPNLVAFITMLGVSGKYLVESPLSNPTPVGASNIMTFGATLAASVVNWSPLTPDQGVYHDHTASALRIWTYTYSGLLLSSMPAHMLGAAFTAGAAFNPSWKAGLGNGNDIGGLIAAVLEPAGGFGKFLVVLLALTTPSQCAPSMYTACNSFMTLAPTFARIPRFFLAIASTAIIIPVAIVGSNTFYSIFSDILGFIGYWLAPYVAVVLVEHVLYRRMRWSCYDVFEAWDDPKHPNLAPSYCSVITFVVSVGFIVVCMDKAWWVGPIARAGTGDVGMLLGFILGIVVYAAMCTAPSRVLEIPHLLEQILGQFAPQWTDEPELIAMRRRDGRKARDERRTLTELACVSKGFMGPALDILWRNLDDLAALLRILPSFRLSGSGYTITEDITPKQWSRFQEYARRVRGLSARSRREQAGPTIALALTLYPNAQDVVRRWTNPPGARTNSFLRQSATGVLIQLVVAALPDLSSFSIDSGMPSDVPSRYLTSLTQLHRLERLELVYSNAVVDHQVLQHIYHMTSLKALDLKISFNGLSNSDRLHLGEAFTGLEELNVSGSAHDIQRLFESDAVRCPNLTSLCLTGLEAVSTEALKDAVAAACKKLSQSLNEVNMFVSGDTFSTTLSLMDVLQPYLSFREMENMSIELDGCIPRMDDEAALACASAWPDLHSFSAHYGPASRRPAQFPKQPTVAALIEFARRCPRLDFLTLSILDVRTLPPPRSVAPIGQESLSLLQTRMYIGGKTANLLDLAIILDLLFPRLGTRQPSISTTQTDVTRNILNGDMHEAPVRMTQLLLAAMCARRELSSGSIPMATDSEGEDTDPESAQVSEHGSDDSDEVMVWGS
ncbi:hypothetical protein EVJ58_g6912 [Rhodofomes roseus]|uniref:Uncharacterized protein n=1 Tax=Rhodofomes roseus TaxID=34475 RepID=A0A4Y9Y592_9APHY|nr:hypothetical protein EVJ58_g6912 [Rhodofomes roseus]